MSATTPRITGSDSMGQAIDAMLEVLLIFEALSPIWCAIGC